jgi:hypothetical protein
LQFILSAVLNGIIVLQFAMYWNNVDKTKVDTGKPVSGKGAKPASKGGKQREKIE